VRQTRPVTSQEWRWSVDSDGVFTYSSDASRDFVGYRPEELLGQPSLLVMDPVDPSQAREAMQTAGVTKSSLSGIITRCRHRNGATVWVDVCGAPLQDATGVIIGFQGASWLLNPVAIAAQRTDHIRARIETVLAQRLVVTAYQPIFAAADTDKISVSKHSAGSSTPKASPPSGSPTQSLSAWPTNSNCSPSKQRYQG
jgi:PAS domain S-box-containing protein